LYETVAFLEAQGVLGKYQKRRWNGKFGELYTYRYALFSLRSPPAIPFLELL